MTSTHPHYPQPGPSSRPYHHPPSHFAFGGNPPYQHPSNTRPPLGVVFGAGYSPQSSHHTGHAYYPHYAPPQAYQPVLYPPVVHQRPPYQQHHMNGGPTHLGRPPNSSGNPTQFIHHNAPRHSTGQFSPPSLPHAQQNAHLPPSVFPKQHHKSPPRSPFQHPKPDPPVQPSPPPPLLPSQEPHRSPPVLSSSVHTSPSPVVQPASHDRPHRSPDHQMISPVTEPLSSPTVLFSSLLLNPQPEPPVPYTPFAERSNSTYSFRHRRPDVLAAVAVNVASAARPPRSYYSLTAPELLETPALPSTKAHPVSPERPDVLAAPAVTVASAARPPAYYSATVREFKETQASPAAKAHPVSPRLVPGLSAPKFPPTPDSPRQQSLASSATTTSSNTPTVGSPLSSITSVSLYPKSPSSELLASPAASVRTIATDAPENAPKTAPAPLKKSWASLLRPTSTDAANATIPTSPNSLPTSSVQGFSIPATPSKSAKSPSPSAALVTLLTEPQVAVGPVPPLRPRGIVNLGNMCFANTVLQILVFCPPFYRFLVELERTSRGETLHATPLLDATVEFMKGFQVPMKPQDEEDIGRDALVPTCIYDGLKEKKRFDSMRGGQQEDAEEFLGFYLDTLEEELLSMIAGVTPPVPAQKEERPEKDIQTDGWQEVGPKNKPIVTRTHASLVSPISRIFGGRFRTALRVPGAPESVIVDPWSRLQLDIQPDYVHTIEDALRHGAAPGTVQVTRPGAQCDASQQTLIDALPPVLVLHLKRFLYDTLVGDVVKLRKRVAFGKELELPKEAMAPASRPRPHKYQLFGVLNHHGSSATGGHYTLDIRHTSAREGWLRIDDELVQDVRDGDLLPHDVGDDRTAYLLFYQLILPPGTRT